MTQVYFIKPIGLDGPIKVGCSFSPDGRRNSLETWSPFALEIIAQVPGDFELERRFHALFIETHQRREWFGWSRRIAATVAAINDGTFNVDTLPAPIKVSGKSRKGKGSRAAEWTPARRFAVAYDARRRACRKAGMPFSCVGPRFSSYGVYSDGQYRAHTEADILQCEAHADNITAQWCKPGMAPVRWTGPYPARANRPADTQGMAA